MKVKTEQFTPVKGHVAEGCTIIAPSGKEFTLKNTSRGWVVHGPDGLPCSGYLPGAFDVEYFVVNGLSSN